MRRSAAVVLLVTGSLMAASPLLLHHSAVPAPLQAGGGDFANFDPNATYADNAYIPGLGYYHASVRWWYPHPVNYFQPGFGYYYGGSWWPTQHVTIIHVTRPDASRSYAYFAGRSSSGGWSHGVAAEGHAGGTGISRGGFGAHGFGGAGE